MIDVQKTFNENSLFMGRMIAYSKSTYRKMHPDNRVLFNANIFVLGEGKIWWGDLDITRDREALEKISQTIGKKLYVLQELDGRFENDNASDVHVLKHAVEIIG
jgi:hypothetical protein